MMRCKYARKPCTNMRSVKANGELHTLCQLHRRRANEIQLRWYTRQQSIATVPAAVATTTEETTATAQQASSEVPAAPAHPQQPSPGTRVQQAMRLTEDSQTPTGPTDVPSTSPSPATATLDDDGSAMCDLLSEDMLLEFLQQIDLDDGADSPTNEAVLGSFARRL